MDKFEYKIINVSREHMKSNDFQSDLMDKLNALGDDGWELIQTESINDSSIMWKAGVTTEFLFVFKRKK
ncbi:MAG: DUF4177 domain-containing protein [Bacteroidetes bacterium]|nr:DUF4177 domain-containing protein [Bacteroidota bacterium]